MAMPGNARILRNRRSTMKHIVTAALALALLNGTAAVAQQDNPNRNDPNLELVSMRIVRR